jgi:hypothetical protein
MSTRKVIKNYNIFRDKIGVNWTMIILIKKIKPHKLNRLINLNYLNNKQHSKKLSQKYLKFLKIHK